MSDDPQNADNPVAGRIPSKSGSGGWDLCRNDGSCPIQAATYGVGTGLRSLFGYDLRHFISVVGFIR